MNLSVRFTFMNKVMAGEKRIRALWSFLGYPCLLTFCYNRWVSVISIYFLDFLFWVKPLLSFPVSNIENYMTCHFSFSALASKKLTDKLVFLSQNYIVLILISMYLSFFYPWFEFLFKLDLCSLLEKAMVNPFQYSCLENLMDGGAW